MVLLEDKDYRELKSGADRSEQLEKEMLALKTLAREADRRAKTEAKEAQAEIERLKREAARLQHNNNILMEHYALSRQRQFGASSEKTPVSLFPMKVRRQSPASSLPEPYLRFSRIRLSTG